jgi:hypothetical protein
VAAHSIAFIGLPGFHADLVVIDETIVPHFTAHDRIEPELLLSPALWAASSVLGDASTYKDTAEAVVRALRERGQELAHLRVAGVSGDALGACAGFLDTCHDLALAEAKDLLQAGRDRRAYEKLQEVSRLGYRALARLMRNLRTELATLRDGSNGTRLAWTEQKIRGEDGTEQKVQKLRYAIDRRREHKLGQEVELILSDGTGDVMLNRKAFNRRIGEHRYSIERKGLHIQCSDHTNSKLRLLKCKVAEKNRTLIGQMICNLDTICGSVMVGAALPIKEALKNEGKLDGMIALHFLSSPQSQPATSWW